MNQTHKFCFFHLLFQVRVVTEVVVVLVTVAAIVVLVGDVDNQVVNSTITGCCSFVQAVQARVSRTFFSVSLVEFKSVCLHQYDSLRIIFINTSALSKVTKSGRCVFQF